jgi:hypothetical protein
MIRLLYYKSITQNQEVILSISKNDISNKTYLKLAAKSSNRWHARTDRKDCSHS